MSQNIIVHNPHSILAALEKRYDDVLEIVLPKHASDDDVWKKIESLARSHKIRIQSTGAAAEEERGNRGSGGRGPKGNPKFASRGDRGGKDAGDGGRTSLASATIRAKEGVSAEELFGDVPKRSGGKGIWIALDSLQDPHNVGAIFRAASFFGIEGVLMTSERSAPLSSVVYDVSCGGVEYVPFTQQINLQRAFEIAKEKGLWILGTSEHTKASYLDVKRDRPWLIVVGNEEKGLRRLTEEACDQMCAIRPKGDVTSLNVSVATGILLSRVASIWD